MSSNPRYASVGTQSVNATANPSLTATLRDSDSRTSAIGKKSVAEDCKVYRNTLVLTKPTAPGRSSVNGPLISSGHTGQKFSATDTQYSLKSELVPLGVPVNSSTHTKEEIITVECNGMVDVIATDPVKFGQSITWFPPPVNSTEYETVVRNLRRSHTAHTGSSDFIPSRLVPIENNLKLDFLLQPWKLIANALKEANSNTRNVSASILEFEQSGDPIQKWTATIFNENINMLKLAGVQPKDLYSAFIRAHCGPISKFVDAAAIANAFGAVAPTTDEIKENYDYFISVRMAYYDSAELLKPIGTAMDSAKPGEPFRMILRL